MGSDENSVPDFLAPFSFKRPLVYVLMCISIFLYIYLFFVYNDDETFGIMERSKGTKILFICMVYSAFFPLFCGSPFIKQIEQIWLINILLAGCTILAMICILPAWGFNKYDHEKLDSYIRLLPFKNSPYIKSRATIFFNNIKEVKYNSGGDSGSRLRFILQKGKEQSLALGNISYKASSIFLVSLYDDCTWLQDDIENEYGSIERRRKFIDEGKEYRIFGPVHTIIYIIMIWVISIDIIGLIIYTLRMGTKENVDVTSQI